MIKQAREWIGHNQTMALASAIAIIVISLAIFLLNALGGGAPDVQAYYYNLSSGKYFKDTVNRVPPFDGGQAVRAHFFSCGQCTEKTQAEGGQRFIGYYEKFTDESKAKVDEQIKTRPLSDIAIGVRLFSKDGKEWFAADSEQGRTILAAPTKTCNGAARRCKPK